MDQADREKQAREAARQELFEQLIDRRCGGSAARMAERLGISESLISRMRKPPGAKWHKPIGDDQARKIEAVFDLADGTMLSPGLAQAVIPDSIRMGDPAMGVAHRLTPHDPLNTPHKFKWEDLMGSALPRKFSVPVPDDSMSPDLEAGHVAVFRTDVPAIPGRPVLVKDRGGQHYIRTYAPRTALEWSARPRNAAWEPLDSVQHGLTIVATLTGIDFMPE